MGRVATGDDQLARERIVVAAIGAEVVVLRLGRARIPDADARQDGLKALAVMQIGPGDDERQRDATRVDQ